MTYLTFIVIAVLLAQNIVAFTSWKRIHCSQARLNMNVASPKPSYRNKNTDHAKAINTEIINTFSKSNITIADVEQLKDFLNKNSERVNHVNVITLMHRCSKTHKNIFHFISQNLILLKLEDDKVWIQSQSRATQCEYITSTICRP